MTQFDFIVLALLLISAAVGFGRGAAREIAAMLALVVAAALAIFGLPFSAPIARRFMHPDWLGTIAALVVVFGVTYLLLRLIGAGVARRIQQTDVLGALDRTVGLLIGLVRGLVVLGALNLMFNAATPPDLQPRWILHARTWPLAQNMGHMLQALAPKGLDIAGRLKPAFDRAVRDSSGDRRATDGYDARQRGDIDDLVEKSR
ncbi:CvpA family protein [Phenylobacterium hankyongense]|uniref:CvpA family protein n=1 Tax=Phenylobacterium hankyongense TaxID=1813876 RepID=A0A328B261_9CAUL|nr:CvpA family protein [Phenylobacterium hankyongense]